MKIIPVDCKYVDESFAASYLLIQNGRGLFIECNTNFAIPHLLAAARDAGLSPEQIDGLIITHVHLDHSGGAGLFLKSFPQAVLYAHPRAARHAIDPSKLIASATAVYGEEFMRERYGEILPCEETRVRILEDGAKVSFQGVELQTKHTRGHANHHLVVFEPTTQTLFTGDSCGVSYPALNRRRGMVVLASTSPTDFDGEAALAVVDWIEHLAPSRLALTHFGFIEKADLPRVFRLLREQLVYSNELLLSIRDQGLPESEVRLLLKDFVQNQYQNEGVVLESQDLALLEIDFQVNAQGLCFVAHKSKGEPK